MTRSDDLLYISDSGWSEGSEPCPPGALKERKDFDDGANALWSLYSKEAQTHDEALFQSVSADMGGVPTFVRLVRRLEFNFTYLRPCRPGLFVAVHTPFLVDSLQNSQPGPAHQAVYYHEQRVAMPA